MQTHLVGLGLIIILVACSDDPEPYAPAVIGLPSEAFAGAAVVLVIDPALPAGMAVDIAVNGSAVETIATDSEVTFVLPDSLEGEVVVELSLDGNSVWNGSVSLAGFVSATEASVWIGDRSWNLLTTETAGITEIWGRVAGNRLGKLIPATGTVSQFDSLMSDQGLRVPGPTAVSGQFLVAPVAAVASDSLEIWQFFPIPQKIARVPRHAAYRQAAILDADRWLITNHHGAETYDFGANGIRLYTSDAHEEPQVIFRSPKGDRTTFSFHGSYLGTPVFGPDGLPVYHISGMRGVNGIAFTPDSNGMTLH